MRTSPEEDLRLNQNRGLDSLLARMKFRERWPVGWGSCSSSFFSSKRKTADCFVEHRFTESKPPRSRLRGRAERTVNLALIQSVVGSSLPVQRGKNLKGKSS